MSGVDPLERNNVRVSGRPDGRVILFSHGFGGTADSWRFVAPHFEDDFRVVVFDHTGSGASDLSAYDRVKYDSLHGYADDIIEILEALGAEDVVYVGHSVAGIMGVLVARERPDLIGDLVLLGPSARYLDADAYYGGFTREAIDDLLLSLEANYVAFSTSLASALAGEGAEDDVHASLASSIAGNDAAIGAHFARVTFLSDNRRDLADVTVPTLVLQSAEDSIASPEVGSYVHRSIPGSRMVTMQTRGHVAHLSHPDEVVRHLRAYLA